jgi:hypothetical protein
LEFWNFEITQQLVDSKMGINSSVPDVARFVEDIGSVYKEYSHVITTNKVDGAMLEALSLLESDMLFGMLKDNGITNKLHQIKLLTCIQTAVKSSEQEIVGKYQQMAVSVPPQPPAGTLKLSTEQTPEKSYPSQASISNKGRTHRELLVEAVEELWRSGFSVSLHSGNHGVPSDLDQEYWKTLSNVNTTDREKRTIRDKLAKLFSKCTAVAVDGLSVFPSEAYSVLDTADDGPHVKELAEALSLFATGKEAVIQKTDGIKPIYNSWGFFDSHSSSNCYLPATNIRYSTKTGKPDGNHRTKPVILEYKGNTADFYEGLTQMLNRLATMHDIHGFFKYSYGVCSAKESKEWWVVKFENLVEECSIKKKFTVFLSSVGDAAEILYKLLKIPIDIYVHREFRYVVSCLQHKGIRFNDCKITLVGCSSSTIWEIKVIDQEVAFVIKVNFNKDRFSKERKALETVFEGYKKEQKQFYVYGIMEIKIRDSSPPTPSSTSCKPDILVLDYTPLNSDSFHRAVGSFPRLASSSSATNISGKAPATGLVPAPAWFEVDYQFNSQFINFEIADPVSDDVCSFGAGLVLMESGSTAKDALKGSTEVEKLYRNIVSSLNIIHAVGVYHSDIRFTNILYFKNFQFYDLIDYDLSCVRDASVVKLLKDSGQGRRCPFYVREILPPNGDEVDYKWSEIDDYTMFMEYVLAQLGFLKRY